MGVSNSGKSTLLNVFRAELLKKEQRLRNGGKFLSAWKKIPSEHYTVEPAFLFRIPSEVTPKGILERALNDSGCSWKSSVSLSVMENILYKKLRELGTRVILIDEFQDIIRVRTGCRQKGIF